MDCLKQALCSPLLAKSNSSIRIQKSDMVLTLLNIFVLICLVFMIINFNNYLYFILKVSPQGRLFFAVNHIHTVYNIYEESLYVSQ
jgi:hypothetical protein